MSEENNHLVTISRLIRPCRTQACKQRTSHLPITKSYWLARALQALSDPYMSTYSTLSVYLCVGSFDAKYLGNYKRFIGVSVQ